jgi:hypothetical protein
MAVIVWKAFGSPPFTSLIKILWVSETFFVAYV